MTKFVTVDKAPESLKSNEMLIEEPKFLDEIRLSKNQPRPRGNGKYLTSLAHLRSIAGTIGELYDPDNFNPYSSIPFNHFVGIEYQTPEELGQVVLNMFTKFYPQIFFRYIDKQLRSRPKDVDLIYFVGSNAHIEAFFANGINQLDASTGVGLSKKVTSNEDGVV